jgi:hypothetical protein
VPGAFARLPFGAEGTSPVEGHGHKGAYLGVALLAGMMAKMLTSPGRPVPSVHGEPAGMVEKRRA